MIVFGTKRLLISAEYLVVFIWLLLSLRCVPWGLFNYLTFNELFFVTTTNRKKMNVIHTYIFTVYPTVYTLYPRLLLISFYLTNSHIYCVWLLLALFRCVLVFPPMSYVQTHKHFAIHNLLYTISHIPVGRVINIYILLNPPLGASFPSCHSLLLSILSLPSSVPPLFLNWRDAQFQGGGSASVIEHNVSNVTVCWLVVLHGASLLAVIAVLP